VYNIEQQSISYI